MVAQAMGNILNDDDFRKVFNDASVFFKNYSAQSLKIKLISQSLTTLNGRLDSVTHAITEATKQAERNAKSSADLANRLNGFTQWLVIATFVLAVIGRVLLLYPLFHHLLPSFFFILPPLLARRF